MLILAPFTQGQANSGEMEGTRYYEIMTLIIIHFTVSLFFTRLATLKQEMGAINVSVLRTEAWAVQKLAA